MLRLSSVVVLLALCVSTGCTHRIWFTQPLREGFELGIVPEDDAGEAAMGEPGRAPDELQYFVSDRITLQREATSRSGSIAKGRVVVRKGRSVERILIRKGTPGVAVDWGPDWVAVSFEKGTHLIFDLVQAGSDSAGDDRAPASYAGVDMPSTYYRLRTTQDDDGHWAMLGGTRYEAVDRTTSARLKVKRKAWTQHHKSRRVLRGRRVK